MNRLIEEECEMINQDKKEKERSDAKNAVEEYVYAMRDKLQGDYEKFVEESIRENFLQQLRSTEDWLYEDGYCQEKNIYVDRLTKLKAIGEPIHTRYVEAQHRTGLMQDMMKSIQRIDEAIQIYFTKSSDKYAHIDQSDIDKAKKILDEKMKWYDQTANLFNALEAHKDAKILCKDIKQQRDTLDKECWAILNKPKPKVEPPKEPEPAKQAPPPPQAQTQIDDEHVQQNGEQKQQTNMDVD